ncbi:MAG TPA: glycoside hydrolase family 38 C-terminal domain-containing protein [Cellulomonas sp.]
MRDPHTTQTLARVDRLVAERLTDAQHRGRAPVVLARWDVPGEPVPVAQALRAEYRPATTGEPWGAPWSTTWLRLDVDVPAHWHPQDGPVELDVDLGFTTAVPGFQAEGLAFTPDGTVLKGVQPRNRHVPVTAAPGAHVTVYVEAAGNPDIARGGSFTPTALGLPDTAGDEPQYRFGRIELVQRDLTVWHLVQDLRVLRELVDVLPTDRPRRALVVDALARALDAIDPADVPGTAAAGRAALADVLSRPATSSAHAVLATGHAHIDSAWLWPTRETRRKVARTYANALDLIDVDPKAVFVCSAVQHLAWLEEGYPDLFARVRAAVTEGRFVLVGGEWVESDTTMPSGESLIRQFLLGKAYLRDRFGVEPCETWLPDSFGFSAAFPQIAVGAGTRWFLTQKMSWNDTNPMPHHTFTWEGLDGTRIYAHFPPVDLYNSDLSAADLDRAERQFADKERANVSLVPFGFGDGGGGPTREMMASAHRKADLEGSPRVTVGSATDFFTLSHRLDPDPPVWRGELYLELHRGVFSSQARTKHGNRRSEALLHEAELWAATATVLTGAVYPYDELEQLWRTVLLGQFHDILPGSAIAWVYREMDRLYAEVEQVATALTGTALGALTGAGDTGLLANPAPVACDEVPAGTVTASGPARPARVSTTADGWVLDNDEVRVLVRPDGTLGSVVHLASGREVLPAGVQGNVLQLFRDQPSQWDAWDVEDHYRRVGRELREADRVELVDGPHGPQVRVSRTFGASSLAQTVDLVPGRAEVALGYEVDWHESQTLLKVAFPADVHTDHYSAETQFGHLDRPLHVNTSWDEARFETCAHRWVRVAEPGFGVAVVNDSVYGHDVRPADDGRGAVLRPTLLRAPRFPDPDADQGRHEFALRLVAGPRLADVVAAGYQLGSPPRAVTGDHPVPALATLDTTAGLIVLETVKLAEDRSGDVVLRLYEAAGGRAETVVHTAFSWTEAAQTDLLERPVPATDAVTTDHGALQVRLAPFRVVTVRLRRDGTVAR